MTTLSRDENGVISQELCSYEGRDVKSHNIQDLGDSLKPVNMYFLRPTKTYALHSRILHRIHDLCSLI